MDLLRLQKALLMCRMAADSTYLCDKQKPGYSTKLEYLDDLFERLFEEEGRKLPDEKIAEKYGVTTDMNEYARKIEELISFGYTKIQIHSSSPDEEEVLRQLANVLPSINLKR